MWDLVPNSSDKTCQLPIKLAAMLQSCGPGTCAGGGGWIGEGPAASKCSEWRHSGTPGCPPHSKGQLFSPGQQL